MNKNTKIWLNYIIGGSIAIVLLWNIYLQVQKQLTGANADAWKHTGSYLYLYACIALMLVNTTLESCKWHQLANTAEVVPYRRSMASYLAGMAFSMITPNRIGEYPGRVLYLGRASTFRYINASVLGVISQLWSVYIFGFCGLVYYNIVYPSLLPKAGLAFCIIVNVFIAFIYRRFDSWVPLMTRFRVLKRFSVYGRLMQRVTTGIQLKVLFISLLRFAIFTAQYLFLLRWMNVNMPPAEGFLMAALFFWTMAVIPSVALAELGVRGTVSIYLFRHFSANTVGMVAASGGIWLLNLVIPSVLGSILIMRMKLLRID